MACKKPMATSKLDSGLVLTTKTESATCPTSSDTTLQTTTTTCALPVVSATQAKPPAVAVIAPAPPLFPTSAASMAAVAAANNTIHLFSMPEYMATPFPGVPEGFRCKYTSKPCSNLRTNKRGGGLHRFCDYHRARANENQWRVDHRRRLRRIETGNPMATTPRHTQRSPRDGLARSPTHLPLLMPSDVAVGRSSSEESGVLTTEELCILHVLLFSDEDDQDESLVTL